MWKRQWIFPFGGIKTHSGKGWLFPTFTHLKNILLHSQKLYDPHSKNQKRIPLASKKSKIFLPLDLTLQPKEGVLNDAWPGLKLAQIFFGWGKSNNPILIILSDKTLEALDSYNSCNTTSFPLGSGSTGPQNYSEGLVSLLFLQPVRSGLII